jgi:hypothetical protein
LCWWLALIQAIHFVIPSEGLHLQYSEENECCALQLRQQNAKDNGHWRTKNILLKIFVKLTK